MKKPLTSTIELVQRSNDDIIVSNVLRINTSPKILLILFMNEIHFPWSWASHLSIYRKGRQNFFRHSTCLNKLLWIMMEAFGLHYSFSRTISKLISFDLFPYMYILFTILWRDKSFIHKPFSMHPLYHKVWWRKHIHVIPRCGVEIAKCLTRHNHV